MVEAEKEHLTRVMAIAGSRLENVGFFAWSTEKKAVSEVNNENRP